MQRKTLTGTRIRDLRIETKIKQSELAQKVGISPAYLNLIEHNKRRIGGKLLVSIARALGVDAASLSEAAEEQTVQKLRDAAFSSGQTIEAKDMAKVDDLARRFPVWCDLMIVQNRQIEHLTKLASELGDRLAHDPFLSETLHDSISTVTAIRSTASILAEPESIDSAMQKRFTENLTQDAERLSESLDGLIKYFDGTLAARSELEPDTNLNTTPETTPAILMSGPAFQASFPDEDFLEEVEKSSCDPFVLSQKFNLSFSAVLCKIAALGKTDVLPETGLIICDGAGTIRFQRPIDGFSIPKLGGACALWPLFQTLLRPQVPVRTVVEMPGLRDVRFLTFAVAEIAPRQDFDAPLKVEATMLILPESHSNLMQHRASKIGISCRICPRVECAARSARSILS